MGGEILFGLLLGTVVFWYRFFRSGEEAGDE